MLTSQVIYSECGNRPGKIHTTQIKPKLLLLILNVIHNGSAWLINKRTWKKMKGRVFKEIHHFRGLESDWNFLLLVVFTHTHTHTHNDWRTEAGEGNYRYSCISMSYKPEGDFRKPTRQQSNISWRLCWSPSAAVWQSQVPCAWKKTSFHVSFTPLLCGLDVLEQNHFSLLTVHTEDSEDGCRYLGEVLRRLVGRQPSPGSASSLPPGRGSQTGFSGWCGCKKKKKSSSDLRGETWKTHTITQCYVFKLYTTLAAVNGYPGDMLPPIALE